MKAECLALWGLLWFACHLLVERIWVIGDSNVLIDHMNQRASIDLGSLAQWMDRITILKRTFSYISFHHVHREKNTVADSLSKKGLDGITGEMHYQPFITNRLGAEGKILIA